MFDKYIDFAIAYSEVLDKYYAIARNQNGIFHPLKDCDLDQSSKNENENIDFARTKYFDSYEEAEIWCSLYGLNHCKEYDNI